MIKWLVALAVTVVFAGIVAPRLRQVMRLGRLPGDVQLRWHGRDFYFPFATTLLLSLLASLLLALL